jgi:tetratricopeptide (TPR) repeat protein
MRTNVGKILFLVILSGLAILPFTSVRATGGSLFSKHTADTAEINIHIRKALNTLTKTKDPALLKANIDTAESMCVKENLEFPAALHLARAEYFLLTSDFRNASQEATIAMKESKNNGEMDILARTLSFLGRYSQRTGFAMESISNFENSIEIAQKNKLKGIIPQDYYMLSNVYLKLGKLKEHRSALASLVEAAYKERDTLLVQIGVERIGRTYLEMDRNFKMADSLLKKCLDIALARKDTGFSILPLTDLGWNCYLEKKYDCAIKYYNKALQYSLPAKIYENAANALGNLGTIYRDLGETEKSLKYYRQALEQAELAKDIYSLWWINGDMSQLYLKNNDTSKAYQSYVLYKTYSDSLLKTEKMQGLIDARISYDVDSHNKEVELLSLKLYNQRLIIYGALGLFVLSIAVLILLLSRAKINSKRRISEMNRKIAEVTQANLRQQMNPHFIFNTLNSIQYYMYQHDKLATNNYLTKFSSLMRKVLENSQHTSVPLRDELDALNLYLELEMIRFKDKFEYEIKVDEEIDTLLYKVPTMLIQPYVENSITHGLIPGENKGFVNINLKLESEYILCTVEDNGIGREAASEKKQMSESNHNSLGTQIISSRLDLVNTLYGTSLKTTYSDLKKDNGEPAGTRVEIQIPILS